MKRKHLLEAATLIVAAVLCALVANAMASRERKMALVGSYPNALKVPAPVAETTTAAPEPQPADTGTVVPVTTTTQTSPIAPAVPATTATVTAIVPTATIPATTTRVAAPVTQTTAQSAAPPVKEDPQKRFPAHPDKAYIELTYPDVSWLHGQGVLTLDARRTAVYEQGHIAGARSMPVWESDVDDRVNKLFNERSDPQSQALPIVIYCSGGDCEDSHMLAQKLWGIQFNNVYVYKDGFPDWQKRGGAVHTGTNP